MGSKAPAAPQQRGRAARWRDWRLAAYLAAAGSLWCVAIGLLLYFLPLGSSMSTSSGGEQVAGGAERLFTASLSDLWPLIVPALLGALATWFAARHHRWPLIAVTVLLTLFAVLAGFSIGLAYVPAVVLLIASVFASSTVHRSRGSSDSAAGEE